MRCLVYLGLIVDFWLTLEKKEQKKVVQKVRTQLC